MSHLDKFLNFLLEQDSGPEADISHIVDEPKRGKIPVSKLNLFKNEGFHNILSILKKATKEEIDYWGFWYQHATRHIDELAKIYDVPKPVAAAVVAVLSPNLSWKLNLLAAKRVMDNWKRKNGDKKFKFWRKVPAYKANVAKANSILKTGDVSYVKGPKVTVFFQSLLEPEKISHDVVLDGHAINIWRGEKKPLKNMASPNKNERAAMIHDYRKVADLVGLSPQAVQAITWYIWKATAEPDMEAHGQYPVEQPEETNEQPLEQEQGLDSVEEAVEFNSLFISENVSKAYAKILKA